MEINKIKKKLINYRIIEGERTMRMTEFYKELSIATGITQADIKIVSNAIFKEIKKQVALGEKINITGFGSFTGKDCQAKRFYNPANEEYEILPEHIRPSFRASKTFREECKGN